MRARAAAVALLCLLHCPTAPAAAVTDAAARGTYTNPVIPGDYPDPGALHVNGSFYVATTGFPFPIHASVHLREWDAAGSIFADGGGPAWAKGDYWAPEIHRVGSGFVAYYTARHHNGLLSIGAAAGASPTGPFRDTGRPLAQDEGGTYMYLDATYFADAATGLSYLIWKQGTVTPPEETHTLLLMQQLDHTGTQLQGVRRTILRNNLSSWEQGVVEAPWLVQLQVVPHTWYYLFYSGAHCCDGSGSYAVGVARAAAPTGPYEKYAGNPILHANSDFNGPGHCSVLPSPTDTDVWVMLYHARKSPETGGPRSLMMDALRFDAGQGWPRMVTNDSSPSVGPTQLPPT